jgi:hypothetical protein
VAQVSTTQLSGVRLRIDVGAQHCIHPHPSHGVDPSV